MNAVGKHVLLELKDCDPKLLNDIEFIKKVLPAAAAKSGATILGESFHQFEPQGVSGVVLIAESHVSIHTWPELGYAAVDIFTCGTRVNPEKTARDLVKKFASKNHSALEIHRGLLDIK